MKQANLPGVGRRLRLVAHPRTVAAGRKVTVGHAGDGDDGRGVGAARCLRKRRGRWSRCKWWRCVALSQ